VLALLTAALVSVASVQCGDDATGRQRVTFDVSARGVRLEGDTSLGWHVRVESAFAAVGPIRWYEGAPLFGRLLRGFSGVAWAHPGHYVPGGALADINTRAVVDLTSPSATLVGHAGGVSGTSRSAHFELHGPEVDLGPARQVLRGRTLIVRGTATRGDATVRFDASLLLDVNIEGIPASAVFDGSPGRWAVDIDLTNWLDRVDFTMVPPPADPGGVSTFSEGSQPANALYRGVVSGASYRFTWTPGAPDGGAR
jgi:hypothetical protein